MKSIKTSSLFRLAALLVIAVFAICMVGFIAESRRNEPQTQPESGETDENSGDTDENTDGDEANVPASPTPPAYTHYLTGLEITQDKAAMQDLCFVMDSNSPLYGIHGASLLIEIPIEGGKSRFLVYQDASENLGKIGSITNGREYMTRLLDFFRGIGIQSGTDDTSGAGSAPTERSIFDLAANFGYSYTEGDGLVYSNKDLILAGLQNAGIGLSGTEAAVLPYHFLPYFSEEIRYATSAQVITLPYGEGGETTLCYDSTAKTYVLSKGGKVTSDLLNGKSVTLQNAFILFADATTYESANKTELMIDTDGGGKGYYFTNGTACEIEWKTDDAGNLVFTDRTGEKLIANRGASYIGFYKASLAAEITFA